MFTWSVLGKVVLLGCQQHRFLDCSDTPFQERSLWLDLYVYMYGNGLIRVPHMAITSMLNERMSKGEEIPQEMPEISLEMSSIYTHQGGAIC